MSNVIQTATALELVLVLVKEIFHVPNLPLGGSHLAQIGAAYAIAHLTWILIGFARSA